MSQQPSPSLVQVKGVRLKQFEQVVQKLLAHVEPRYIPLPLSHFDESQWNTLPPAARVQGSLPGQLADPSRAKRKQDQLTSMLRCIFALLRPSQSNNCTIVDFGGGSGHLSIPLALMLPKCTIVVVDLKEKSLDFLHQKARACVETNIDNSRNTTTNDTNPLNDTAPHKVKKLQPTAITNLWTFMGDIESYTDPFQIGVALHVCGEATDVVLRKCAHQNAHLVVAPCCVGKLSRQKKDPYIYRAKACATQLQLQTPTSDMASQTPGSTQVVAKMQMNAPTIQYPQSQPFQQCLTCRNEWDALAKAADYSHALDMKDCRNAAPRTAKGLLELDRQLFLDQFHYQTALTRMDPLTASPKNDILVGYHKGENNNSTNTLECLSAPPLQEDPVVAWTKAHLLHPGASVSVMGNPAAPQKKLKTQLPADGVDWTWQEEHEIRSQLSQHFGLLLETKTPTPTVETFTFPTGMGGRKRKLIHFVADQLGLAHWCVGKKQAEKTVAVRKRYVKTWL